MEKRVNLTRLEYFRAVGRTQHVTQAAMELGLSQPALSRAISTLESEIGIPLFERRGRSVNLTPDGKIFLDYIERAFRVIEDGYEELGDRNEAGRGRVSIGFLRSLSHIFIPQLVGRFRAAHHEAQIGFFQSNSDGLEDEMKRGRLDLIFVARIRDTGSFTWVELGTQEIHLVVPVTHPIATQESVSLAEVKDEPFISFRPGHAFRVLADAVFASAGLTPKIAFECDDGSYLMTYVAAGLGIALVPPNYITPDGFKIVRLSSPHAQRSIGVAWQNGRYLNKSALAFLNLARAAIRPDMTFAPAESVR